MLADSCNACGAVPLAGNTVSQVASLEVVKLRVPDPVLVTFTVTDAGLPPPAVAVIGTVVGDTDRTGCGGGEFVIVKVTVIVAGEPCAPGATTVMWPV